MSFEHQQIVLDAAYEEDLIYQEIIEYQQKLAYIFNKLYKSHVLYISAIPSLEAVQKKNARTLGFSYNQILNARDNDGVVRKIDLPSDEACNCFSCRYHNMDLKGILESLNLPEGKPEANTLENAYAHYKMGTENYKHAYQIYKVIESEAKGDEMRMIEYFVAKYNMQHLHNLILDDSEKTLRKELRSIDLDRIINDELDLYVGDDVRRLLLETKQMYARNEIELVTHEM
jgi:hypothetical protein